MKNLSKDQIVNSLINYAANVPDHTLEELRDEYGNSISSVLVEFDREWNNAPCDPEGATAEQDANLDSILDRYADDIIEIIG